MNRRLAVLTLLVFAPIALSAQPPPRPLVDAMRTIYGLRNYSAFDWISGNYLKGTLTLQGYSRTPALRQQAEDAARKTAGIDEVVNEITLLPALTTDDDIRIRAYVAIYSSSGLERYAPGGQFSSTNLNDLNDSANFGLDASGVGRGPHAIHIVVNGGRVLLLGEVRTVGDRRTAEAAVRTLTGILGVTSQVRVQGQK